MKASAFRKVAIGHVDTNKPIGSKIIQVVPSEMIPMRDGEMTGNATALTYDTKDIDGTVEKGGVLGANVVEAEWYPNGVTNRLTAPDVRRGERVELWQAADDDKFWWSTMGLDDHLRKLETLVLAVSATKDEGDTELTASNTYFIELSSHSKMLAFKANAVDAGDVVYEASFDMGNGKFTVNDGQGNFAKLDTREKLWHVENGDGTYVKLDRKDIKMFAPQDLNAEAKRNVEIKCGQNLTMKAGVKALIDGGGSTFEMTAAGTVWKTPDVQVTT